MPKVAFNVKPSIKLSLWLLFISTLTACSDFDDHDHPDLKSGEALFNHHCETCHGENGTGKLVSQTPANILTRLGQNGIVNYITADINNPAREMPVFSTMSYAEAATIAAHLLSLQRRYEALPLNEKKPRELMIEP